MTVASVTKTDQQAGVSIGTVVQEASPFRSMGKTPVNMVGQCDQQYTFNGRDEKLKGNILREQEQSANNYIERDV